MRGIVPDDILDALKKKKLGLPGIDIEVQEDRNAMQMGEFEVIKELLAAFPEAKIAKAQVDKLIDLAAPPPRGTGGENIRECIIESKMTFDVSADDWQAYLKAKIMNNIERYFYLIVFAMFIREVGPKGFPQSFLQYMDAHPDLRTMIDEGRGKLEWERKIPDEKLEELKTLLAADDFKANLNGRERFLMRSWRSLRPSWPLMTSREICQRSSSASMSFPGTCSETFQEVTTRTTQCTNLPAKQ